MSPPARLDRLRTQLLGYRPHDELERGYRAEMLALCGSEGDPFARTWFVPGHFTASALVTSPDESALLLVYHRKLKRWLQPGGHVEPDDPDMVAAARREVGEEAWVFELDQSAQAPFDIDVHHIPRFGAEGPHCHFDIRVLFRARTWTVGQSRDVAGVRWVPLEAVDDIDSDASVVRAARKILARR